jgi:GH18 family chitinase
MEGCCMRWMPGLMLLVCWGGLAFARETASAQEIKGSLPTAAPEFRVAAYLPDYRLNEYEPRLAQLLTDLIVFSVEPTADGGINRARLAKVPWAELRQWKTSHRVRLIVGVGGWERSKHFAAMATSPDKRRAFIAALVKYCLEERLDGIDLDWEHPQNAAEEQAYADLLVELRAACQPHGLLVSFSMAGWQQLPREAFAAAHWVNLMAYDRDGRHATFEGAVEDIDKLKKLGVPPEKIVLGMPFYGLHIERKRQPLSYAEILAKYDPKPDVDEVDGFYFNGVNTVRRKTEYALKNRLGGVMAWELGQDVPTERSLVRTMVGTVKAGKK